MSDAADLYRAALERIVQAVHTAPDHHYYGYLSPAKLADIAREALEHNTERSTMIDLESLAKLRQEKHGPQYTMPDGTNQAMARDNGLDILEELADALNIAELWWQRIDANQNVSGWVRVQYRLLTLQGCLLSAANQVNQLRSELPADMLIDQVPVDRDEEEK